MTPTMHFIAPTPMEPTTPYSGANVYSIFEKLASMDHIHHHPTRIHLPLLPQRTTSNESTYRPRPIISDPISVARRREILDLINYYTHRLLNPLTMDPPEHPPDRLIPRQRRLFVGRSPRQQHQFRRVPCTRSPPPTHCENSPTRRTPLLTPRNPSNQHGGKPPTKTDPHLHLWNPALPPFRPGGYPPSQIADKDLPASSSSAPHPHLRQQNLSRSGGHPPSRYDLI
jgi:hypothetical protein